MQDINKENRYQRIFSKYEEEFIFLVKMWKISVCFKKNRKYHIVSIYFPKKNK